MKRNWILYLLFIFILFGCARKINREKNIESIKTVEEIPMEPATKSEAFNVLDKNKNLFDKFNTLQISAEVSSSLIETNFGLDIRIEKGKQILVHIKKFGFAVAKLQILSDSFSFYDRLKNVVYQGDFSAIYNYLPSSFSYETLEKMLLAGVDKSLSNYKEALQSEKMLIRFEDEKFKSEYFLNNSGALEKNRWQLVSDSQQLEVVYKAFQTIENLFLPSEIFIDFSGNKSFKVQLLYKNISVNQPLNLTYRLPKDAEIIKF